MTSHNTFQDKLRSEVLAVVGQDRAPAMADQSKVNFPCMCDYFSFLLLSVTSEKTGRRTFAEGVYRAE